MPSGCCVFPQFLFGRRISRQIKKNLRKKKEAKDMSNDASSQSEDQTEAKCTIKRVNSGSSSRHKTQKEGRDSRNNSCRHNSQKGLMEFKNQSRRATGNFILMMELKKKILIFRDIIDLSPCDGSTSIDQLMIYTMKDLHKLYPETIPCIKRSDMRGLPLHQVVRYFCVTLEAIGDPSMITSDKDGSEYDNFEKPAEIAVALLDSLIKMAREKFDIGDEDEEKKVLSSKSKTFGKVLKEAYSENSSCGVSPITPTSVLPEMVNGSPRSGYSSPLLLSLRVQAVGKLNPVDVKRLAFHMLSNVGYKENKNGVEEKEADTRTSSQVVKSPVVDESKETSPRKETLIPAISEVEEVTEMPSTPSAPPESPSSLSASPSRKESEHKSEMEVAVAVPESKEASDPEPAPSVNVLIPPPPPLPPPSPMLQPRKVATGALPPPPPPPPPPQRPSTGLALPSPSPLTPPPSPELQPNVEARGTISIPPPPPPPGSCTAAPPPPPPVPPSKGGTTMPPPPPMPPSKGGTTMAPPPPPMANANGNVPPPPPPGAKFTRKATTKLKRSSHMGNMYRVLKGKIEGNALAGKSQGGRKASVGGNPAGGKQGMADALAEMTKRSAYFQQIEEDVQNYSKPITELKSSISNFKPKDMPELLEFHKSVESILESLVDETQVLSRFEGFPSKKLEALRAAAALYTRLESIVKELQSFKAEPPLDKLLDKVERYFNKMKVEIDALERTKDEEVKKFKSHNLEFDFHVLVRIKEATVDLSSNCMELALKERREAKATEGTGSGSNKPELQKTLSTKHLWRVFQFAFRVYTFAGGIDEHADKLTRELAQEIENDPQNQSLTKR